MSGSDIFERLSQSLDVLESAITNAVTSMEAKGGIMAEHVAGRITSYNQLISKQRVLAAEIQEAVVDKKWETVAHKVKIVNGLLELIRDDAKAIIQGLKGEDSSDDDQMIIC